MQTVPESGATSSATLFPGLSGYWAACPSKLLAASPSNE